MIQRNAQLCATDITWSAISFHIHAFSFKKLENVYWKTCAGVKFPHHHCRFCCRICKKYSMNYMYDKWMSYLACCWLGNARPLSTFPLKMCTEMLLRHFTAAPKKWRWLLGRAQLKLQRANEINWWASHYSTMRFMQSLRTVPACTKQSVPSPRVRQGQTWPAINLKMCLLYDFTSRQLFAHCSEQKLLIFFFFLLIWLTSGARARLTESGVCVNMRIKKRKMLRTIEKPC